MHIRLNMQDWKIAENGADETTDTREWVVNVKAVPSRIDVEAKCPDGTKREVWIEINDGNLVVHAYDPDHDEPVNLRISKTGIKVDADDRGGAPRPMNYDIEQMEQFVAQMARFTTPEDDFEALKDEDGVARDDGVSYDDVDEMIADMSDERLGSEYSTFMEMVKRARELVK